MTRRQIMTYDHSCTTLHTVCMHAALIGGWDCETDFGGGVSSVSIGERASASIHELLAFLRIRQGFFVLPDMKYISANNNIYVVSEVGYMCLVIPAFESLSSRAPRLSGVDMQASNKQRGNDYLLCPCSCISGLPTTLSLQVSAALPIHISKPKPALPAPGTSNNPFVLPILDLEPRTYSHPFDSRLEPTQALHLRRALAKH